MPVNRAGSESSSLPLRSRASTYVGWRPLAFAARGRTPPVLQVDGLKVGQRAKEESHLAPSAKRGMPMTRLKGKVTAMDPVR
jgi:hypothetical protein